ncbi:MAG: acetyl-CoA carboxylase biotin carboxyl carrier protein subunit [Leptospirales bacterium]|nr:acetyl-CoA carboxylase biotin carboxyl carrier protein subunit [Leptospirales bacterium]
MFNHFLIGEQSWRIDLRRQADGSFRCRRQPEGAAESLESRLESFELRGADAIRFRNGAGLVDARFACDGEEIYLLLDGRTLRLRQRGVEAQDQEAGGRSRYQAPMPGKVLAVQVSVGQRVEPEQPLLVIEAMKMEQTLRARRAGVALAVHCAVGDLVSAEQILVEVGPEEGP